MRPALQPDLVARPHLGRDGDEAGRQVLDPLLSHRRFEPRPQPVAAHQPAAAKRHVDEIEHAAPGQRAGEILEFVEPPRGIAAADHGADRGADDDVGGNAHLR